MNARPGPIRFFVPPARGHAALALRGLCCALLWVACCVIFAAVAYGFCEPI